MRIAVIADDAGTVDAEHQMQPLQGCVVDEHIIRALQKARVDRRDGLEPLLGHAAGHRDRVPFRDADIVEAIRMPLGKGRQARAGSSSASCESVSPNTCEKSGFGAGSAPVTGSNELTPWYFSGACSV